ncbi:Smr/MutS family protein [Ectothiorhodospiraceae bacterium 2226]|nr:Smr/MutS family protein [Ectothiorhodospiraceae bacterium 2226]
MTDDDSINEDERALFRAAVADVIPLRHDRVPPPATSVPPRPRQLEADEQQVLRDLLSDEYDLAEVETGEELLFQRPGIQQTVMRRLRRGHYVVQGELDLHGMTVPVARAELAAFLFDCRAQGARCVRVIHGKGHGSRGKQPVLKVKVNGWLRQWDDVLAFASAQPVDGGTGAVYVLLRRPKSG